MILLYISVVFIKITMVTINVVPTHDYSCAIFTWEVWKVNLSSTQ